MGAFRRLLGYLRPYVGRLIAASVLLSVGGAMMAMIISLLKPLINEVLLGRALEAQPETTSVGPDILELTRDLVPTGKLSEWARKNAFVQVPLLILAAFFIRSIILFLGQYITIKSGARVIRDIRAQLYEAVAFQSLDFFQTHPTGTILSRILNDVARLQRVTTIVLADLVRVVAMVPFVFAVAFYHDWRMTLIVVVALPLLGYPVVRLGRRLRRASTVSQENMALVSNRLTEAIGGVKVVQGFGMERYEIGRFDEAIGGMLRADFKAGKAQALAPAVMELTGAAVGAGLFYAAGLSIARGSLDPGNFTVVLFCLGLLFMSVRRLNTLYSEIQAALAAAARVFDMLDRVPTIVDRPGAMPLGEFAAEIRFDGVEFSYGDEPVLQGIDLTIRTGETVALVGGSGAGKSTVANLLLRFYDPSGGRILVDGQDIRDATLASLRGQIGLVTQETVLFDDTVRNNIAYGRSDVGMERIVVVAKASRADDFIRVLPDGYDTTLGERGTRLSMGQRQRLTIARALLKNSPILVLDEATSALDAESESLVQKALEHLMQGRTSVVIAHRLATVRNADRIVVLERGRIVEEGSHEELVALGGAYARLHELQFEESRK